jgi:hypothetical protein
MLKEMPKHPAGRPSENPSHDESDLPPTLADLGIDHNQSSRWQAIASVPEGAPYAPSLVQPPRVVML